MGRADCRRLLYNSAQAISSAELWSTSQSRCPISKANPATSLTAHPAVSHTTKPGKHPGVTPRILATARFRLGKKPAWFDPDHSKTSTVANPASTM